MHPLLAAHKQLQSCRLHMCLHAPNIHTQANSTGTKGHGSRAACGPRCQHQYPPSLVQAACTHTAPSGLQSHQHPSYCPSPYALHAMQTDGECATVCLCAAGTPADRVYSRIANRYIVTVLSQASVRKGRHGSLHSGPGPAVSQAAGKTGACEALHGHCK